MRTGAIYSSLLLYRIENPLCVSGIIQVHVRTYTHMRGTRIPSESLGEGE
jgi:hypothetical protein